MEENYRYGIQFVSKITGINSHTVRAWENRYNAITPMRDKNKRRLYSNEQIKRLKALKGLVDFGNSISDIAGLPDEELLNMLDKFVPSTKQKIQTLETRKKTLEILENSLKNIQSAANEFLIENTSELIETHRQQIEQIYNKIVRHPSFEHIKLEIKSTDPLVYSIMVYDDEIKLSTQAATRLSSAQMNSFAMSVLITNNLSQNNKFSLLMMDDPTQSMDSQHKDALAKLILEISDKRQIIIATSDDEFLKCLQNTDKDIKNIELKDWSRQGISLA